MKFIHEEPEIPDTLLKAQEEGELVLFCGAGISAAAGLPDFKELVKLVYQELHIDMEVMEEEEFEKNNYDRVLGILENRLAESRTDKKMRNTIKNILTVTKTADLSVHRDLLRIAKAVPESPCRIVTTNFDNCFELLKNTMNFETRLGSTLPSPKKDQWEALVYLHGLCGTGDSCGDIVTTSADFGTAYLTEGWGGRFVSGLFTRYYVLFIGYSMNDPVMRYLVDAIAADKKAGEEIKEVFALAGYRPTDKISAYDVKKRWEAMGITPLVYNAKYNHKLLKDTLREWAEYT